MTRPGVALLCALAAFAPTPSAAAEPFSCEWDEDTLTSCEQVQQKADREFSRVDVNINLGRGFIGPDDEAFKVAAGLQVAPLSPLAANCRRLCDEHADTYYPWGFGPMLGVYSTFTDLYGQVGVRFVSSMGALSHFGWRFDLAAIGGAEFEGDFGVGPAVGVSYGVNLLTFGAFGHYAIGMERPLLALFTLSIDVSVFDFFE